MQPIPVVLEAFPVAVEAVVLYQLDEPPEEGRLERAERLAAKLPQALLLRLEHALAQALLQARRVVLVVERHERLQREEDAFGLLRPAEVERIALLGAAVAPGGEEARELRLEVPPVFALRERGEDPLGRLLEHEPGQNGRGLELARELPDGRVLLARRCLQAGDQRGADPAVLVATPECTQPAQRMGQHVEVEVEGQGDVLVELVALASAQQGAEELAHAAGRLDVSGLPDGVRVLDPALEVLVQGVGAAEQRARGVPELDPHQHAQRSAASRRACCRISSRSASGKGSRATSSRAKGGMKIRIHSLSKYVL